MGVTAAEIQASEATSSPPVNELTFVGWGCGIDFTQQGQVSFVRWT